ncbi:MAG TPA: 1-deoxy-D-xylulose-5-phosphate synthase [Nitrospiria bacterium]|nr:1-deoxy-D-xylulose-5-phosphate synthase [Nitrospiria bacterium]
MMRLLDQINAPEDLRRLSPEQLPQVAAELRDTIINTLAANGGHFAGPLGAVDLNVALHYVFDTPRDRLVWDVGYQAYAHKLLTGRRERFHTLRQLDGISGFPLRAESSYDTFGTGHAATSISAALGMAEGRDLLPEGGDVTPRKVVAIIGDGSMTAGMAFEGLNQAGALKTDLIVVLNDNSMAISENVGALSSYLTRIITGKLYTKVKEETEAILRHIPKIGPPMLKMAKKAEESMKGLFVPGLLFEEMGFRYIGPIDGHRLDHLVTTFENVKHLSGPLLVHVITHKGKGYEPAERNPIAFHGVTPFDRETGRSKKAPGRPSYTTIFANTLIELARSRPEVVAITAAMPEGTGLNLFAKEFPDRYYDVGIAEQHAVTFAAGLATEGVRPVVAIYSTFLQRGYDQVVHDVCLQNLPVLFCLDRGGLVGEDGATHHGVFDFSYLRHIPNMVVMAPKDENELRHMLLTGLLHPGPCAIRYPRGESEGVTPDPTIVPLPIGRGEIVRDGDDVALVAIGAMVPVALKAADLLRDRGVAATVVNARFVKPLDRDLLLDVAERVRRIVTIEDQALMGGFGSAVLELFEEADARGVEVRRIGLPDAFIEHGAQKLLRQQHGLDPEGVAQRVMAFLKSPLEVSEPV